MEKSVFLKVSGTDYSASEFESDFDANNIYQDMLLEGLIKKTYENDEDYYFVVEIYEFGVVDPKFESFVVDVLGDYDQMKASNFYRVV